MNKAIIIDDTLSPFVRKSILKNSPAKTLITPIKTTPLLITSLNDSCPEALIISLSSSFPLLIKYLAKYNFTTTTIRITTRLK